MTFNFTATPGLLPLTCGPLPITGGPLVPPGAVGLLPGTGGSGLLPTGAGGGGLLPTGAGGGGLLLTGAGGLLPPEAGGPAPAGGAYGAPNYFAELLADAAASFYSSTAGLFFS